MTRESADGGGPKVAFHQLSLWRRFHVRMSGMYGVMVVLVLIAMGLAFYRIGVQHQIRALQSRLRTVAVTLSHQIRPQVVAALNQETDAAKSEYRELIDLFRAVGTDEPQFVSIYVLRRTEKPNTLAFVADYTGPGRPPPAKVGEDYDATQAAGLLDGFKQPTVEDQFTTDKWGTVMSGYAPIRGADGQAVAVVGVDVSSADILRLKTEVATMTLSVLGCAALGIVLITWIVGRNVHRPLSRITDATTQIASGHLQTRVKIKRQDEFGILGNHLDQMAAGLAERETIRATFGRFVSEDVARRILSSQDGAALGGEERLVTVLLTDLAGYSTVSEKLAPADVVELLNTYFGLMGDIIERHKGCVIEFPGDGILCVFGAPESVPNHAELAVRCALEMQAKLAEANRGWAKTETKLWYGQGTAELRMRVGIHTGTVIAGNIGTKNRVKYSMIGDSVNVAARVEQLNKDVGTELLMTEETLMRVREPLRSRALPKGEHKIKGRKHTVIVYTLPPEAASAQPAAS